jgi:amino acid transporter
MDQSAMPHAMLAHAVESSDAPDTAKLDRVFGTASLVMFGLAYLVPLTVFTTFGAVTRMTEGHLPLAYVVTTIAMLFTAFSYASLVRVLPFAGSAFAYSTRAFGSRFGFLTGWTVLLDYILLPAINYLIIGIYLNAQFASIPAAAWILGATVIVSVLNIVGVDIVKRASVVLVVAQLVFAAIFVAAAFLREGVTLSAAPLYEPGVNWSQLVAGAAILCLSFLGFDAVSTLSEEAKDPERTVPRAIMLTTIIGGAVFVLLSYAGAVLLPDWQAIVSADSAGLEVMQPLGSTISMLFLTAYLAGCIASAVASQAGVSRILFAMGRESVLPRAWFGHLSGRFHTPTYSILTVAAMSLVVLFVSLETVASLISFGALFAFSVVNLSVMRVFLPKIERPTLPVLLRYAVSPLIGLLLTGWLWFHLSPLALTVGLCWLGAGLAYSLSRHLMSEPENAGA